MSIEGLYNKENLFAEWKLQKTKATNTKRNKTTNKRNNKHRIIRNNSKNQIKQTTEDNVFI